MEQNIQEVWNYFKRSNILIMEYQKKEEKRGKYLK